MSSAPEYPEAPIIYTEYFFELPSKDKVISNKSDKKVAIKKTEILPETGYSAVKTETL